MLRTLAELKNDVRNRADLHKDGNVVSDAEMTSYINMAFDEMYDMMITADDARTFTKNAGVLSQTGDNEYTLPPDMYRLVSVHDRSNGQYYTQASPADASIYASLSSREYSGYPTRRRLYFFRWDPASGERKLYVFPAPNSPENLAVTYFPQPVVLTEADDKVDNPAFWLEYVVVTAGIKCLNKIERDSSALMLDKKELTRRIKKAISNLDMSGPTRIRRMHSTDFYSGGGY